MEYKDMKFTGERALFGEQDAVINGCVFESGESPCKECRNITTTESLFRYKYPFWYGKNISLDQVTFFEMARAGIWYTDHISVSNSIIEGPKNFRRCHDVKLSNVLFSNALETLWRGHHGKRQGPRPVFRHELPGCQSGRPGPDRRLQL